MESYSNLPTAADYANAAAQSAQQGVELNAKNRQKLEERVVILEGQVSFLAGLVADLLNGQNFHTQSELDMLMKIHERGKE